MIFIPKALPDYKWLGELKEKLTLLQETSDPVGDRCSVGEPLYRTDGKINFCNGIKYIPKNIKIAVNEVIFELDFLIFFYQILPEKRQKQISPSSFHCSRLV